MGKYDAFRERLKRSGNFKRIPANKIIAWIQANFDFKTRKDGSEYLICDPFTGDSNFNFNINPERGVCHSWHGDEWAGPLNPETRKRNCSIVKFIKVYRKCSYRQALEELLGATEDVGEYMRPEGRISVTEATRTATVALPDGVELLAASKDRQASSLRYWLGSRGYSQDDIEKAELYHLGMDVYWPYFEFEVLVYWQSRSRLNKRFDFPAQNIYDDDGNIIAKTEGTKGDFFYGFDRVELASYLIITEAIFDQHTLGEQALASGGADLTPNQIKKLKILCPDKGIILSPDNDRAGLKSVLRNHNILSQHGFNTFFSLPPKCDYIEDSKTRHTKDWNEILTKLKLSRDEVRAIHDQNIARATTQRLLKLQPTNR